MRNHIKAALSVLLAVTILLTCFAISAAAEDSADGNTAVIHFSTQKISGDDYYKFDSSGTTGEGTLTAKVGDILEVTVSAKTNTSDITKFINCQALTVFNTTSSSGDLRSENNGILAFTPYYLTEDEDLVPVEINPRVPSPIYGTSNSHLLLFNCTSDDNVINLRNTMMLYKFAVKVEKAGECNLITGNFRLSYYDSKTYKYINGHADLFTDVKIVETAEEPTTEDPTTVEPTTVEPTTEEPTIVEPTTIEPTTEAPTTVEPTTEPAASDVYSIVGEPAEIFGGWDASSTKAEMTKDENGVYSFTTHMEPVKLAQFKIVKNHAWDNSLGSKASSFRVKQACDVTITYNPDTSEINVAGDSVEYPPQLEIDKVVVAGDGYGNWLNGKSWDVESTANEMTQVSDGIYEITFNSVVPMDNYAFKFTANGSWEANWGGEEGCKPESGTAYDALFDGNNIHFSVVGGKADVKIQLDLRNYDKKDKTGAKYTVTVTYTGEPADDYKIGDVNNDGNVNGADAGLLARYAAGWKDYDKKIKNMAAADINKDGFVNGADAGILSRHTSGWSNYAKYFN